jgi:hypothetical protein
VGNRPGGSLLIKTMDQLEETFLKRWGTREDPNMVLMQLMYIRNEENETVKNFNTRFEKMLQ